MLDNRGPGEVKTRTARRHDEAKREFETELANDPASAQALAYLGDIELERNNLDQAASLLGKATQHDPDLRIAFLDLGTVRMQQKVYPAAVKALERAIALDPKPTDAHYRLGRVYQAMGNRAGAEKEFAVTRELHESLQNHE